MVMVIRMLLLHSFSELGLGESRADAGAACLTGAETRPSIIGATCTFCTKIYNNVGGVIALSAGVEMNKRKCENIYFCSEVPACFVR